MKNGNFWSKLNRTGKLLLLFVAMVLLVGAANIPFDGSLSSLSNLYRWDEFNFASWVASALVDKFSNATLGLEHYIDDHEQAEIVLEYLNQIGEVENLEFRLEELNSDPNLRKRTGEIAAVAARLQEETERMHQYGRIAESILQNQTERSLVEMGFGVGGQLLPPLLFKVTDLPLNLIVSPRGSISTLRSISLKAGMDALEKESLENSVYNQFGLSALVEPVGGLGAYPTMVMRSRSINWLTEVISHEWFHNYLSFFPLGVRYFDNDPIRSVNETTANLAGKEVGRRVMNRFYPTYVSMYYLTGRDPATVLPEGRQPTFNFRKQMRETRLVVDYLLSIGQIERAERFMEDKREFFWQNGYRIRKLNQAYFAFYGSYNDTPGGGAAGDDPVGPAVQQLREESKSLKGFIDTVKRIKSYDDLLTELE